MISTRGRYALRVMIDLAHNGDGNFIPMKEVAARQDMSPKYLEQILPVLTKNKLVEAVHGKGGGYKLAKDASEIRVSDVLRLTEKNLEPVACLAQDAEPCDRKDKCSTIEFWQGLNQVVNDYLDSKTIADLL